MSSSSRSFIHTHRIPVFSLVGRHRPPAAAREIDATTAHNRNSCMTDPAFPTASGGIVFVDDDDDEIVDELLKLEGDLPGLESAAKVNTQIKLCIMLLCLLPILGVLIILSWRQYGARINDLQRTQRSPAVDKKQS